ncbi:MAG: NFACT family protein, partial [Spirochaetota bacterium]
MSLNWREIDAVLDEAELAGTHVQQVIQPDFRNLYLEIFRPGNRFYLRICFETGKTRIHTTDRKPQKPPVRQRFAQLLHSRITGGRIVAARQLNSDRIIRIDVERASERTILWIRLWGGAANCIVTDEEGAVIDAFFRRPGKGEVTGGSYFVEEQEPAPSQREKLDTFTSRWADSINEQVREHYAALEQQERYERAREQAEATLRSQIGSVRRRLSQLNGKQGDTEDADRYQTLGDLILANLYRIEPGASWIEVEDYTRENEPVTIELDPAKSPQANAERYFDRAQKARGKRDAFADEIANLEQRLERLEREEADLDSRPTDELRAIVEEFAPVGKGRNEG